MHEITPLMALRALQDLLYYDAWNEDRTSQSAHPYNRSVALLMMDNAIDELDRELNRKPASTGDAEGGDQ